MFLVNFDFKCVDFVENFKGFEMDCFGSKYDLVVIWWDVYVYCN